MPHKDKEDQKEWSRKYYQKNKEYIKERTKKYNQRNEKQYKKYHKEYYQKNKEQLREYYYKKTYSCTFEEIDQMLISQNHKCPICRKSLIETKRDIDHDSKTGKIRGILCDIYNRGLGHFYDNPEFLERAILYLKGGTS